MDSTNNNYNPFQGFNPQTALTDVRNQIMDAYGRMNQGGEGMPAGTVGGQLPQQMQGLFGHLPQQMQQGFQAAMPQQLQGLFGVGGATAGFGDAPNQQNLVGQPQGGPWATQPLPQSDPFAPMGQGGTAGGGTWGQNMQAQYPQFPMQQPQMPQQQMGIGNTMMPNQQSPFAPMGQPQQMPQYAQGQAQPGYAPPQQMPQGYQPTDPMQTMANQISQFQASGAQGGGIGGGSGQFGLPVGQGTPGGGPAVDWLRSQGMPIPAFLQQASNGQPIGAGNYNEVLSRLGDAGGLPSLQSLNNLNPSEQAFLQGFFETVLGIPYADVLAAAQRPFAGLGGAVQGRANWR